MVLGALATDASILGNTNVVSGLAGGTQPVFLNATLPTCSTLAVTSHPATPSHAAPDALDAQVEACEVGLQAETMFE